MRRGKLVRNRVGKGNAAAWCLVSKVERDVKNEACALLNVVALWATPDIVRVRFYKLRGTKEYVLCVFFNRSLGLMCSLALSAVNVFCSV